MDRERLSEIAKKIKDYFNQVDFTIPTPFAISDKVPDIPQLERKYVLMYLLDQFGPLYRSQITALAQVLYRDNLEGVIRPILGACQEAKLLDVLDPKNRKITRDPLMNHVALSYSQHEMEENFSVTPLSANDLGCGLVDVSAGSGASRPLLLDLYSLKSPCILRTTKRVGQEMFIPTPKAKAGSEALQVIFKNLNLRSGLIVEVGP